MRTLSITILSFAALLLAGCQPYSLKGRVIHGPISSVQIVDVNDIALEGGLGVRDAVITLTLDPDSLGREHLGTIPVRQDGTFSLPLEKLFGAGFLEDEVGIAVRAKDFNPVQNNFIIPGHNKRVLITLQKGRNTYKPKKDPLDEVRSFFKNQNNR